MGLPSTIGAEVVNWDDRILVVKAWRADVLGRLVDGKPVPPIDINPLEAPAESTCVTVVVWPSRPVIVSILVNEGIGRYPGTTCVSICDLTTPSKNPAAKLRSRERALLKMINAKEM